MKDNVTTLLEMIPNIDKGERFILGIDGLSRSGKTTLVDKLSQTLQQKNVQFKVFHIDDFIVERNKRYDTQHEEWYEYYNLQWDVEWLRENLFQKIKTSIDLNLPYYDADSDTQIYQTVEFPETFVIIIEGVFLQRREWRSYYDVMVYLDCEREQRFLRESDTTQKNREKFINRYWKAEDYYLDTVLPAQQADLVLKN